MRRFRLIAAVALATLLVAAPAVADGDDDDDDGDGFAGTRTYRVTLSNRSDSQPISPPVVVTHDPSVRFWQRGATASPGLIAIAEDGNPGPAFVALGGLAAVTDVVNVGQPLTRRGTAAMGFTDSFTLLIDAAYGDRLSFAGMLICTNDGFVGLDSVHLPDDDDRVRYYARGYDAGSEVNTERSEDIVDPCSGLGPVGLDGDHNGNANAAVDSSGVITHHRGIVGESDLLPAHNWPKRVVKVTIELVDGDDD